MKKVLFAALMMFSSVGAFAQHAVGSFNLQPKIGVSIANLTDIKDSDPRVGLVAGVEGEYQVSDIFSISAGALYSMQGAKRTLFRALGQSATATTKLDYINVPIMANVYVVKGLAVKLGIQPGFKVSSTEKTVGNTSFASGSVSGDIKAQSVDFSIPVGISYEYSNFQLDARYNWGLTKVFENGKSKNSVFQITLGYKFDL
ncbi:porin family protein [Prevotella histicola]|uniref:porin family protein n=1 Tax=Prevotella histicola TaxID=470565 RepID=UPI001C5E1BBC|nr:porin family protein [Prevotella histicola]MBW4756897.1 PorT family protein [Prevotella histicola]